MELYNYKGKILSAYDCDTLTILFDLGFNISIKEKCRLHEIDAPEIRGKNQQEKDLAIKGRDFVRELIVGETVEITTYKPGKFGRMLIKVYIDDGQCLNDLLVEKGYARKYDGGKREGWFI